MNDHDISQPPARRRLWRRVALVALGLVTAAALLVAAFTRERFGPLRVPAADGSDRRPPRVGFAIVKTASLTVREGLLFAGGDLLTKVQNHFSAFLVKHDDSLFLFDTGLGRHVGEQYRRDMPLWRRPFFRYEEPVTPARDQLTAAGVGAIDHIFLSHAHWDHASAIEDFPGASVWVAPEEMGVIRQARSGAGSAWPSQVASPAIAWQTIDFVARPYEGFDRSADLFGDGTVVLVPMSGHTAGSIGLFLRTDSGARFFFVGDVVWSAAALAEGRPRSLLARQAVDHDADATRHTVEQIREAMRRDPSLVVVPAHDGTVQRALGTFPAWVRLGQRSCCTGRGWLLYCASMTFFACRPARRALGLALVLSSSLVVGCGSSSDGGGDTGQGGGGGSSAGSGGSSAGTSAGTESGGAAGTVSGGSGGSIAVAGGAAGATGGAGGASGTAGTNGTGAFAQCATGSAEAQARPVDLYVMLDRSGSMVGPKWESVKAGLGDFFADPGTTDLRLGLQFFPLAGSAVCSFDAYATPAVPVAALPGGASALDEVLAKQKPSGETPTLPALQGAQAFAASWAASNPDRAVAVLLATDDEPNVCGSTLDNVSQVAANGRSGPAAIPTFVIGVGDLSKLDQVAASGGTDKAFLVDGSGASTKAQLVAALAKIRDAIAVCTFPVPSKSTIDKNKVNVTLTRPSSAEPVSTLGRVDSLADCPTDGSLAWAYDSAAATQVELCPSACSAFKASAGAHVDLVFGCDTIINLARHRLIAALACCAAISQERTA